MLNQRNSHKYAINMNSLPLSVSPPLSRSLSLSLSPSLPLSLTLSLSLSLVLILLYISYLCVINTNNNIIISIVVILIKHTWSSITESAFFQVRLISCITIYAFPPFLALWLCCCAGTGVVLNITHTYTRV